jgi:uncharacterized protein (DUF1778 family)
MTTQALARQTHGKSVRRQRSPVRAAPTKKADPMSIRMDPDDRWLIARAAQAMGQNMTQFLLSSARDRATEVLLNQSFFRLESADWSAFVDALESPPPPNAKLKALLAQGLPWEH